jgi:protein-S-isoprenylcysteine O-methyltransferase Ste14
MLLLDNLQIGIWNAWIGTVLAWANLIFLAIINKEAVKRLNDTSWYRPQDKKASQITMVFMIIIVIYSVWLPLQPGSIWFYIGLILYIIGTISNLIALHNYGTTPAGEPIIKGMYKLSRNPLYVCWVVVLLGMSIACLSIPLLILSILYSIPTHFLILGEERYCLETYGESYKQYMSRVPRYLGRTEI